MPRRTVQIVLAISGPVSAFCACLDCACSACRSGSDSSESEEDAEKERKPIPKWARGQALTQALVAQMAVDPDEIFKLHQKTCPLNEVFEQKGEPFMPNPHYILQSIDLQIA